MAARTITPEESLLTSTISSLRSSNSSLGIPKLHTKLLSENPTWLVSEKRLRKILSSSSPSSNNASGSGANGAGTGAGRSHRYPISKPNPGLDVEKLTGDRVDVRVFGGIKGKGLIAKRDISTEEVLWKEDPFALAAEWEVYDLILKGGCCAYCSTPLQFISHPPLPCPSSSSSSQPCYARFCNRLCLSRATTRSGHTLLCPCANAPSEKLLAFARKHEWQALHALSRCAARILGNKGDEDAVKADWGVYDGLAVMKLDERYKWAKEDGFNIAEPVKEGWEEAYKLFIQTFHKSPTPADQKRLDRLLGTRWTTPKLDAELYAKVQREFFSFEGFLGGLGRMSLNMESHGGIYPLHSHINHNCTPNVSIRHFDQTTALSRITVLASSDIKAGEELVITYVDPKLGVKRRRERLGEWGFGKCMCERCTVDEKENADGEVDETKKEDDKDLARELKEGLGLV